MQKPVCNSQFHLIGLVSVKEGRHRRYRDRNTISNKRLPGLSKRVEGALSRKKKRHLSCALSLLSVCAFVPVCLYLDLLIKQKSTRWWTWDACYSFVLWTPVPNTSTFCVADSLVIYTKETPDIQSNCSRWGLKGSARVCLSLVGVLSIKSGKITNKNERISRSFLQIFVKVNIESSIFFYVMWWKQGIHLRKNERTWFFSHLELMKSVVCMVWGWKISGLDDVFQKQAWFQRQSKF